MKAYGGTCPFCCGDIQRQQSRAGDAACSFCDLALEPEVSSPPPTPFSIVPGRALVQPPHHHERLQASVQTALEARAGGRRAV